MRVGVIDFIQCWRLWGVPSRRVDAQIILQRHLLRSNRSRCPILYGVSFWTGGFDAQLLCGMRCVRSVGVMTSMAHSINASFSFYYFSFLDNENIAFSGHVATPSSCYEGGRRASSSENLLLRATDSTFLSSMLFRFMYATFDGERLRPQILRSLVPLYILFLFHFSDEVRVGSFQLFVALCTFPGYLFFPSAQTLVLRLGGILFCPGRQLLDRILAEDGRLGEAGVRVE